MAIDIGNDKLSGGGIHHVAVFTRDLEASLRLYRDLLGMKVVGEFDIPERRLILLDTGNGSHIELVVPTVAATDDAVSALGHPLLHVALTTTVLREMIERIRRAGHEITVEPKEVRLGPLKATVAFFKGPSNELIELFQTS